MHVKRSKCKRKDVLVLGRSVLKVQWEEKRGLRRLNVRIKGCRMVMV